MDQKVNDAYKFAMDQWQRLTQAVIKDNLEEADSQAMQMLEDLWQLIWVIDDVRNG